MPITADLGGKKYTLGRGRVFFDRFANGVSVTATTRGDGERYLGNTPEFSTTSSAENLDHYDSDAGVRVKDSSVQLTLNRTGKTVVDNIDKENVALYFLGTASSLTQGAATGLVETITVKKGRFYQLGATEALPAGVRNIASVVIKKGSGFSTTVTASGNYEIDEVRGRIFIENNATDIPDDTDIQVTYNVGASVREQIISGSNAIYGALRFVSDNPKGDNRDYFFPYVKMAPDGDYNLKGDDWQKIGFTFEVLRKSSNVEALYIDGIPA